MSHFIAKKRNELKVETNLKRSIEENAFLTKFLQKGCFFFFFYGPWLIFKPAEIRDEKFSEIKNESFINKICQLKNSEMNRERYFLR